MTLKRFEALNWASSFLSKHDRDANIGEILLCHRLGLTRTELLVDIRESLKKEDEIWFKDGVIQHVKTGEPVQYMTGTETFYGRTFHVSPAVLIPRPETEELIEWVKNWANLYFPHKKELSVCDIGTGSGAIAITLALEKPEWHVSTVDLSADAIKVAKDNAKNLHATVDFYEGSFLQPLIDHHKKVDILVSNPPYISKEGMRSLQDVVKDHEPHLALSGGEDGLDAYRCILKEVRQIMKDQLLIGFEIGYDQGEAIQNLIKQTFDQQIEALKVMKDINGNDRVALAFVRSV
ncbi:peptide chain release factor N(5)-glutamine methyltransferase [Terrilactibacillus laevilacticus]|uniref:peptide chain release factor N(5)-glutamine methyltransferase n=1 Tax=Terrilactibacillus laevilacticus TaxID=1380157 RepID=UPI0011478F7A|nr:peptide chain release factor N(5)-glutamine methyltransferase [Terrilactibacillus laevilacticus]